MKVMVCHHNAPTRTLNTLRLMFARMAPAQICTIALLGAALMALVRRVHARVVVRIAVPRRMSARETLALKMINAGLAAVMQARAVGAVAETSAPTT